MTSRPVIFISAVSKELHTSRDLVAKTLLSLGYEPKWQDIAPTETGDLCSVLRKWVDDSSAVIQIVGKCYGMGPQEPDPEFGTCSFTQYEALYARKQGKTVWYLFIGEGFTSDAHEEEPEELRLLQQKYRERVQSYGHLFHPFTNPHALEAAVLRLRDDLTRLRRRSKQWAGLVLGLLIVLALGLVWMIRRQSSTASAVAEVVEQNKKLLIALRDLPQTLNQQTLAGQREDQAARMARGYAALEEKLKLPKGVLEKELSGFAEQLLQRPDASALDRANALFATKKFVAAEAQALKAKDDALAAPGHPVQDQIKALELAGKCAEAQIQFPRALAHYRAAAALTSAERDSPEWARVQRDIAFVLGYDGQFHESEILLRQMSALQQRVLGAENRETLKSRTDLAYTLSAQGNGAEAEKELRGVVPIMERALGPEHPDTLITRNGLAYALSVQGKFAEAERESRAVLAIMERVLGPEHYETSRSRFVLANALYDLSRYPEAEKEHRKVLESRKRMFSSEHPDVLMSRNNLALTLYAQGNYAGAEKEHRAVLAVQERVLGPEHPDTLLSRFNLANAVHASGNYAEAEKEFRAVLAIRERLFDAADPLTAVTRNYLAYTLSSQDKFAEAEREHRKALAVQERVLGAEHPDALRAREGLAYALSSQGKRVEAEKEYREVLAIQQRVLGADHLDTLRTRDGLASALHADSKFVEAETEYRSVLASRERVFGTRNPNIFASCHLLALCLEAQGKKDEALPMAQRAWEGRRKILSEQHPDTLESMQLLDRLRSK